MKMKFYAKEEIKKEFLAFLFGILSTAIGFFLALYFNNKIENQKELDAFSNIKKGILCEVKNNTNTLENSFKKYSSGIILNSLNTSLSEKQITNEIFLKYANQKQIEDLQNYLVLCNLCNIKKDQIKSIRIQEYARRWEENLQVSLDNSIRDVEISIQKLKRSLSIKRP